MSLLIATVAFYIATALVAVTVVNLTIAAFRHAPINGHTCGWSGCPSCYEENAR